MNIPAQVGTLLTAVALCVVLGSNVAQLSHTHGDLETIIVNQRLALANATKAETQLDALARGTQALANGGNANAARIIAVLQANGVRISNR